MVFLIQKAQNKDSLALQIKLNELIASSKLSSNSIVEEENLKISHSIDEANKKHNLKEKAPQNTKTTGKTKTTGGTVEFHYCPEGSVHFGGCT